MAEPSAELISRTLARYQKIVGNEIQKIRFIHQPHGLDAVISELLSFAGKVELDDERFGWYRHSLAIHVYNKILRIYPQSQEAALYLAFNAGC